MAGLSRGTRTPTSPSRRYRSVNASAKSRLSGSMSRSVARSGPCTSRSGSHARIGPSTAECRRVVADHAGPLPRVVVDPDHPVQPVADLLDVRNENYLREPVAETPQEREHVLPAGLVQRAEDLVEHQERQRLARTLRDHLGNGEPQDQVRKVLLAAREDRL